MAASKAPLQVKCPQCGTQVEWNQNSPFRPFCSKRCRLIDLGEWASEGHRIPGEPAMDETDIDALIARMERGDQQQ